APDFNDNSGGVGRRIPDFTVDGRNHTPDGALSNLCPNVSPFSTIQATAQTDLTTAANTLKREVVTRANSFCQADGSNATGICTPGLSWVRGNNVVPRFTDGLCSVADPSCYLNLNFATAALRATALPPLSNLPTVPEDRGPLGPVTGPLPF